MSSKRIIVDFERSKPDAILIHSKRIIARHEEMADTSPLKRFDMPAFTSITNDAGKKLQESRQLHAEAEGYTEEAYKSIGIHDEQSIRTPGTVYNTIGNIRSRLKNAYQGSEEKISAFGFNVVNNAGNIRIDLPRQKIDSFFDLVYTIYETNKKLGDKSPIADFDIEGMSTKTLEAQNTHKKAKNLHAKAEAITQDAYQLIGIYKKQTIRTKGTLYNYIGQFRTELMIVYQGNEEELSRFGYNVVVEKPAVTIIRDE